MSRLVIRTDDQVFVVDGADVDVRRMNEVMNGFLELVSFDGSVEFIPLNRIQHIKATGD